MIAAARRKIMDKVRIFQGYSLNQPHKGWICALRNSLGMTTTQLAKRVGISQPALVHHEKRERSGSITIQSLRKIAAAMNCKFVYYFVPNEDLENFIERKAEEKALKLLRNIEHTMALEDQSVSRSESQHQLKDLVEELKENPKKIWESDV